MHTWDKKTIYHSNLRTLCKERGEGLVVMLNANPLPSAYPGKPPFVPFYIQGDKACQGECCAKDQKEHRSYTYQVENDAIGEAIQRTAKKMWLKVTAVGGSDDAELIFERIEGGPLTSHEIARSHGGSAPVTGYETLFDDYVHALEVSHRIHEWWNEQFPGEELTESIRTVANSLHIQAQRDGWEKPLHSEIETPQQQQLGDAPTDQEINDLLDQAPVSEMQIQQIRESLVDGIDTARRFTIVEWLRQKIAEGEATPAGLFD